MYIYTFLKGWEISSLGQTLASASADPLTFSSTFLLMSSNLYHIQDNALGMPTDLSALLMAASCFSQVKICWNPSRYLFAPHTGTVETPSAAQTSRYKGTPQGT